MLFEDLRGEGSSGIGPEKMPSWATESPPERRAAFFPPGAQKFGHPNMPSKGASRGPTREKTLPEEVSRGDAECTEGFLEITERHKAFDARPHDHCA